ncbi:MAG: molecular chaperone DnaK, partial [Variovorax sp.]
ARLVLVCDVGGGTTDLSLVRVDHGDGAAPRLERIAVGRHLMLGGDNMDLALAHVAESRLPGAADTRLSAAQLAQLVERCRDAKERLLAADAPASAQVTLLGAGSRLIGAARSATLERDEVERIVVDGFFPRGSADEGPRRERSGGLVAFGLPYASDPAVTRHIAGFLAQHAASGRPDALLLNGGVFRSEAIADRLHATLGDWRGAPLHSLHNADPDVAVARGAVAYALARRGLAPRIGGGSPRSYFLPLDEARSRAVCVLPRGSEEGREIRLEGRSFELRVGEPVRFDLVSAIDDGADDRPVPRAGELVDLGAREVRPLPPVTTVVRAGDGAGRRHIAVELAATLTEVGTLDVQCIALDDPSQRWQLAFQLRADAVPGSAAASATGLPPRFSEAVEAIERVFGARDRSVGPRDVKQLRGRLESLLGGRERWPTALLRPLYDALWQRARGRHRSADHERLWLSLAGWCLRPGFGDPLDGWRIERLWPIFESGVRHGRDRQVQAEWWTFWRRVAGGLDGAAQERLLQDFALNLQGDEAGLHDRPPELVAGGRDDMVRLGASLERVPVAHKVEIGDWLVDRVRELASASGAQAGEAWTLWAIGRIGARSPLYGSAHGVVPTDTALAWLDTLLALDWALVDGAAAAAANLARSSGDRARDLPSEARERVVARLQAHRAPPAWSERVREVVVLDEAGERGVFGESLPPGLRLIG